MPPRKKRANPEAALQIRVKEMLKFRLPETCMWIGGAAGLRLPMGTKEKARAQGIINPGWPDLSFMTPVGARFIEMKAKDAAKNALSTEQRKFRDICLSTGADIWAECRSVEEVVATLTRWGVELLPDPFERHDLPPGLGFLDGLE